MLLLICPMDISIFLHYNHNVYGCVLAMGRAGGDHSVITTLTFPWISMVSWLVVFNGFVLLWSGAGWVLLTYCCCVQWGGGLSQGGTSRNRARSKHAMSKHALLGCQIQGRGLRVQPSPWANSLRVAELGEWLPGWAGACSQLLPGSI